VIAQLTEQPFWSPVRRPGCELGWQDFLDGRIDRDGARPSAGQQVEIAGVVHRRDRGHVVHARIDQRVTGLNHRSLQHLIAASRFRVIDRISTAVKNTRVVTRRGGRMIDEHRCFLLASSNASAARRGLSKIARCPLSL